MIVFSENSFEGRLENSLDRVRLLLDREKAAGLQLAGVDSVHSYEDKYTLVEQSAAVAILAILNDLQFLGLTNEKLLTAKQWSQEAAVSLRLDISSKCKYLREETRKETSDVNTEAAMSLGAVTAKVTSKVVTKITEYFYEQECTWRLNVVRGMGLDEANEVLEIASRTATQECVQRSKEFPFAESTSRSESCELGWALDWLQVPSQKCNDWIVSVQIDRSKKTCHTPSRNEEVKALMESLYRVKQWADDCRRYFEEELWRIHRDHHRQGHNQLDISMATRRSVFMPLQPLFRDLTSVSESAKYVTDTPLASTASTSSTSGLVYAAAAAAGKTSEVTLGGWEVNVFLGEQRRSLQSELEGMQEHFPSAATTSNCVLSQREAGMIMALGHATRVAGQFWAVVDLVESMLRRQLVRAIGKEVTPVDFATYMRFHYRRLFRAAYRPQVWSVSVRRTRTHAPEGSLRLESQTSSGLSADGFQPLECFCASRVLPRSETAEGYTSIALNAATRVLVGGERHVHGWLGHRFSSSDPGARDLRLSVTSRQFSGFIVLLGRMTSGSAFEAKHGFLVQNTEELVIPLWLETIPNAQQFREAISSLSAEQQRFAQAYRSMQLESTLFGLCVVQVKPQLEKVLNLAPDSLTKELQLTQDLLKLFVQYQISADLLSYEPPPMAASTVMNREHGPVTAKEKVEAVRANVQKMMSMLEGMKQEEVRQQYPGGMPIKVATLTGRIIELQIDPFATVAQLKRKILEVESVPPSTQRLVFAGKQLEDDVSLNEYGIVKDSTVHLILRLRGGPSEEVVENRRRLSSSISETKEIMAKNIDQVLSRGEALDSLELKSDRLHQSAVTFKKSARKSMGGGGVVGGIMGLFGAKRSDYSAAPGSPAPASQVYSKLSDAGFVDSLADNIRADSCADINFECDDADAFVALECEEAAAPIDEGGNAADETVVEAETNEVQQETNDDTTENKNKPQQDESVVVPSEVLSDVTKVPRLLDDAFDRLDVDHAVRPGILQLGDVWRHRKARPLSHRSAGQSSPLLGEEETVDAAGQTAMKQQAFDLLDALTRSGGLACEDAALHIVVAATHTFDESVLETVVQKNMNPIEAVERSSVIMASVLHGLPGHKLVESSELHRLQEVSPVAKAILGV